MCSIHLIAFVENDQFLQTSKRNHFKLNESFLDNRHQQVVLNGQSSDRKFVTAGVSQGTVLSRLFFLIYINDIPQGLISDVKLFADDTSLSSVVNNAIVSASVLNNDSVKIEAKACKWKMTGHEFVFYKKLIPSIHMFLFYNNSKIEQIKIQNHFGLILDQKLASM